MALLLLCSALMKQVPGGVLGEDKQQYNKGGMHPDAAASLPFQGSLEAFHDN